MSLGVLRNGENNLQVFHHMKSAVLLYMLCKLWKVLSKEKSSTLHYLCNLRS